MQTSLVKAVYLHVPFCGEICPFCPFTVKHDSLNLHEKYVLGVQNEIECRVGFLNDRILNEIDPKKSGKNFLESLYIGGGTPSRLKTIYIKTLIKKVYDFFPWSKKIEISIEMNPEDVKEEYLKDLFQIGINRISLGGQSFKSSTLEQLGRSHSNHQLREAINIIKKSEIDNWNIDLIFGVPYQSFSMFKDDIEEALKYKPPHISLYGLEIHTNTRFGKDKKIINWESKNIEQFREMYLWAVNRLKKAHLFQYEVSNFAKEGKEGRNNLLLWSGNEYLGFGVGAHSYYNKTRFSNKKTIKFYLEDLYKKILPIDYEETLSNEQLATEFLMLSLRQKKGINFDFWLSHFGLKFQQRHLDFVKNLCDSGLAFWDGGNLCLSPKGFLLSDRITLECLPFDNIF